MDRCPGQDLRYLNPEDVYIVHCPHCKAEVEFFKDEPALRCPGCKEKVSNPKIDLGCAKWCAFAEECLGVTPETPGVVQSLSERLIAEIESVFGSDRRRIDHAKKVLAFAERILEHEQADPLTVKAAAILHDIGIHEAERKHGSSAGRYQEIEGPPIARAILKKLGVEPSVVEHVCRIVGSHHSAGDIDTPEFRILWDADWLVNIPVEHAGASRERLVDLVGRVFKTHRGRAIAEQLFLLPPDA